MEERSDSAVFAFRPAWLTSSGCGARAASGERRRCGFELLTECGGVRGVGSASRPDGGQILTLAWNGGRNVGVVRLPGGEHRSPVSPPDGLFLAPYPRRDPHGHPASTAHDRAQAPSARRAAGSLGSLLPCSDVEHRNGRRQRPEMPPRRQTAPHARAARLDVRKSHSRRQALGWGRLPDAGAGMSVGLGEGGRRSSPAITVT
jgi:hypothetical protein